MTKPLSAIKIVAAFALVAGLAACARNDAMAPPAQNVGSWSETDGPAATTIPGTAGAMVTDPDMTYRRPGN